MSGFQWKFYYEYYSLKDQSIPRSKKDTIDFFLSQWPASVGHFYEPFRSLSRYFDWQFYVYFHNLVSIKDARAALDHYASVGIRSGAIFGPMRIPFPYMRYVELYPSCIFSDDSEAVYPPSCNAILRNCMPENIYFRTGPSTKKLSIILCDERTEAVCPCIRSSCDELRTRKEEDISKKYWMMYDAYQYGGMLLFDGSSHCTTYEPVMEYLEPYFLLDKRKTFAVSLHPVHRNSFSKTFLYFHGPENTFLLKYLTMLYSAKGAFVDIFDFLQEYRVEFLDQLVFLLPTSIISPVINNSLTTLDVIDILMVCKDNQAYFSGYIQKMIEHCVEYSADTARFFLYESNSTNDAFRAVFNSLSSMKNVEVRSESEKDDVMDLHESSSPKMINEICKTIKSNSGRYRGPKPFRMEFINLARKRLQDFYLESSCTRSTAKWILLLDSDVYLSFPQTIQPLLNAAQRHPEGVMFCANTLLIVDKEGHTVYYDTLAFEYGSFYRGQQYKQIQKYLQDRALSSDRDVAEIEKSAFGGCALVRSDVYRLWKSSHLCQEAFAYDGYMNYGMCEHYSFCQQARKHGKIFFVFSAKAYWCNYNPDDDLDPMYKEFFQNNKDFSFYV